MKTLSIRNEIKNLKFSAKTGEKKFEVVASADGTETTVYVYAPIESGGNWDDAYGISPKVFIDAINAIKTPVINMRINSPGGDVFSARVMEAAIKGHSSKFVAYIDGIAASAASILAIAADQVQIAQGGFIMIHNASTWIGGTAKDMLETASMLLQVDNSIADTYVAKTGIDKKKIQKMMDEETWFGSTDAVEQGFADAIMEFSPKNCVEWDLSSFSKAPGVENRIPKPIDESKLYSGKDIIELLDGLKNVLTPSPEHIKFVENSERPKLTDAERKRQMEAALI
jgi:ATP-dependent Clp protease protease subunit